MVLHIILYYQYKFVAESSIKLHLILRDLTMYRTFNFFPCNNIDTAFPTTLTQLMTRLVPHYMYVGLLMETEQSYTPINAILVTTDYQSKASGSCST